MKSNLIINDRSTGIENALITLGLALFPLLYLTVRGWTNLFAFILFGLAAFHFSKLPRPARTVKNISAAEWAVIMALASGFFAILISQLIRSEILAKPYDGPLRMLLAAPVFLLLVKKKINFVLVFQYVCPISLLILLIFVHSDPIQMRAYGGRFSTYFVDPNSFGTYTMLLTFMCLFSIDILGKDSLPLKILKITGIISGLYLEMKSQTRGAWIAEPIMLALWLALYWRSKNKLALLSSVLMCLLGILLAYFFIDFFHARVNSIYVEIYSWLTKSDTETPTGYRLSMWQITWTLFKQSPWHGYGDLGYQYKLMLPEFQSAFSKDVISLMQQVGPHNECLANMLRSGILGLVAVLLQFFVPAIFFIRGLNSDNRRIKGAGAIGLCLVTGMIIAGISMEVLTLKYANSFYGLMIAGLCASVLWEQAPEIEP